MEWLPKQRMEMETTRYSYLTYVVLVQYALPGHYLIETIHLIG